MSSLPIEFLNDSTVLMSHKQWLLCIPIKMENGERRVVQLDGSKRFHISIWEYCPVNTQSIILLDYQHENSAGMQFCIRHVSLDRQPSECELILLFSEI